MINISQKYASIAKQRRLRGGGEEKGCSIEGGEGQNLLMSMRELDNWFLPKGGFQKRVLLRIEFKGKAGCNIQF